jgi:hypothetical protein
MCSKSKSISGECHGERPGKTCYAHKTWVPETAYGTRFKLEDDIKMHLQETRFEGVLSSYDTLVARNM